MITAKERENHKRQVLRCLNTIPIKHSSVWVGFRKIFLDTAMKEGEKFFLWIESGEVPLKELAQPQGIIF